MKIENWIFESKSSMDKKTKRKTTFVFCSFIGIIAITLFIQSKTRDSISILIASALLAIYLAAIVYGFLNTPYSYKLSNEFLVIYRRRLPIKILLKDIRVIREFSIDDRKGLVKTFGAEGVIGNVGRWSSNLYKSLHVLTSRDTNWTLVRTKQGKNYIISPDNIELIQQVNELMRKNYGA